MRSVRAVSRLLLAGVFVDAGLAAYRDPRSKVGVAAPVIDRLAAAIPGIPADPAEAVRLNAAVQVGAAATLAVGVLPRLSALVLAGSLVPTTFGGHRFWEIDDPARRAMQRVQFLKNAAMLGGLLVVALD